MVINAISFNCPVLATSRNQNQITYSFVSDGNNDVDSYIITLYEDGLYKTEQAYNSPFSTPTSGSFTGLNGLSEYTVILSMKADELTGTCDPVTGLPVVCVSITDINASSLP